MGICASQQEKEQKAVNDKIEQELKQHKLKLKDEMKMLLLGAGESGKSTILKQMKLLHDNGYSDEEKIAFKDIIFSNLIQSMKVLADATRKLKVPLGNPDNEKYLFLVLGLPQQLESDVLPSNVAQAIKSLWNDTGIQACYLRANEFQLNDSAGYYFENIDRISMPNYLPTDQDVLRSRVKTIGITETTFNINGMIYRMFDVGGQRSERKKWIHCFENVTAIIFLAAISEYDQMLAEDDSVNRMLEALNLFDSICNSRWFVQTSMILFLNKKDKFAEKLKRSPLGNYFPEYSGSNDYESASQFMQNKFVSLNQSDSKQVYCHFTCATDCDQIRVVMEAVYDIIVQANLRGAGLM